MDTMKKENVSSTLPRYFLNQFPGRYVDKEAKFFPGPKTLKSTFDRRHIIKIASLFFLLHCGYSSLHTQTFFSSSHFYSTSIQSTGSSSPCTKVTLSAFSYYTSFFPPSFLLLFFKNR